MWIAECLLTSASSATSVTLNICDKEKPVELEIGCTNAATECHHATTSLCSIDSSL